MRRSFRFIRDFLLIIVLFMILYSYAMFQGGFVSWFLFFSFLPIFLYHLGLLFYPIHKWKVARVLSHHTLQAGGRIFVTLQIKRTIPFPLYYCIIEDNLPQTLQKIDKRLEKYMYLNKPEKLLTNRQVKKTVFPWFRKNITLQYDLNHIPRGEHKLQMIRIRTGDVFGFIKKEHHFIVDNKFLVYPNQWQIYIKNHLNSLQQGTMASYIWNTKRTNVATSIREYIPGDKYSWIDWKQTARKNMIMTKEFEQEKNTDTLFILDRCYYENLNPVAFEGIIELTTSLITAIGKNSPSIHLLSIGENIRQFSLSTDVKKMEHIRKHLAKIQPVGKGSFSNQLQVALRGFNQRFVLIFMITQIDHSLVHTIQQLKYQAQKIKVFLIKAETHISEIDLKIIQQLQDEGVRVYVFSENDLKRKALEVSL